MNIATWNVNSVIARLPLVTRWLEETGPDVLCLQEIKCTADRFPREPFSALGYEAKVYGQPTYNGVAILSRIPAGEAQHGFPGDPNDAQARVLSTTIDDIRITDVYVPNGQAVGTEKYRLKLEWMKQMRRFLDEQFDPSLSVLLCGDFNVAPTERDVYDPALWEGRILFSRQERAALEHIKDWGFIDSFRIHTKEGGHYTWWDYRAGAFRRNLGLRIDHIWISQALARRCRRVWIDREPRGWERPSDHTPVVAEFE